MGGNHPPAGHGAVGARGWPIRGDGAPRDLPPARGLCCHHPIPKAVPAHPQPPLQKEGEQQRWSVQLWGGGLLHFNASAISCPPGKCWSCVFNMQHAGICTNRNLHQKTCVRNLVLKSKISSRSNEDCTGCCLYPFPLPKLGNFTENQWHSQTPPPPKPSRIA